MAAERPGATILVNIFEELFPDIYQNRGFEHSATILQVASKSPLPAVPGGPGSQRHIPSKAGEISFPESRNRIRRFPGRGGQGRYPELSRRKGFPDFWEEN